METREISCAHCGAVLGFLGLPEGTPEERWAEKSASYGCPCQATPEEEVQE